jgi:hypothetical protein
VSSASPAAVARRVASPGESMPAAAAARVAAIRSMHWVTAASKQSRLSVNSL